MTSVYVCVQVDYQLFDLVIQWVPKTAPFHCNAVALCDVPCAADRCLTDQLMTCTLTAAAWTDIHMLTLLVLDMHKQHSSA